MVAPEKLAEIKSRDPHPIIKVFSIAHPGEVNGHSPTFGNVSVQYFEESVRKIYGMINNGLKCFLGHGATNDHTGRTQIGEVVGKSLERIGDLLHDVVAIHVFPEHRDKVLDVASMEVNDVLVETDSSGKAFVKDVGSLMGIALGDGRIESPGFSGATLLAEMQAFQKEQGEHTVDKAAVMAWIKENSTKPSDLFDKGTLSEDRVVRTVIDEQLSEETKARERAESNLNKAKERHVQELEERDKKIGDLEKASMSSRVDPLLKELYAEMKLNETEQKFISKRQSSINLDEVKDEEGLKKAVRSFVDGERAEFKSYSELFGQTPTEGDPSRGAEPNNTRKGPGTDLTDPANNALIPQGESTK